MRKLLIILVCLLTGCSSSNKSGGDFETDYSKIQSLISLSFGIDSEIKFEKELEPVFQLFATKNYYNRSLTNNKYIGWCIEGLSPAFNFELKIVSNSPLRSFANWALITYDDTLYADSFILNNTQPNSKFEVNDLDLPEISCKDFSPAALIITVTDNEYFYEQIYTITENKFTEKETGNDEVKDSWSEYQIKEGPYRVSDSRISKRLFDF